MLDVLIAGAGPAGAIAARSLALRGARVLVVDRATFPRDKLCGDTLNPGAIKLLAGIGLTGGALLKGLPIAGMRVTGPAASVVARYKEGELGVSLLRRDLDLWLIEEAIAAGARFEAGLTAESALMIGDGDATAVRGLVLRDASGLVTRMPASVTIAADGRRSAVARSVGLGSQPASPRRWAYGIYFERTSGVNSINSRCYLGDEPAEIIGEMHVRPGWYAGVVRVPGDRVNVCVIVDRPEAGQQPLNLIRSFLARDPELKRRFADVAPAGPVSILGPLAVNTGPAGVPGLFLAGDAAGFVDPMTGDGLNLAMRGALLAAEESMRVLDSGDWEGAVERLNQRRMQALGPKLRFNRIIRSLTSSSAGVHAAGLAAKVAPGFVRKLIIEAGDAA
jgi:flavin-dependent dehydrogenase